jgi:ketosteroid isomerase-like protein
MSQENVTVVEASFDAFNTGDLDAWEKFLAPDVIWQPPDGWPEPGPYLGRDAVLRHVAQLREAWDRDTAEPIGDLIHTGDRVVASFIWHGAGQGPEAICLRRAYTRSAKARSVSSSSSETTARPSKPWASRSRRCRRRTWR